MIWLMNSKAEIVSTSYTKSIIRSRMSFTYEAAQKRIDDPSAQDPLTLGIRQLNILAKLLRARRFEAGALTLASPEVRFRLEHDSQDPVDVELKQLQETNALVEEFMLLANISVAEKIYQRFPDSALLRRHPRPNPDSFGGLQRTLTRLGFELDVSSSKALADSLDQINSSAEPYLNTLARIMTTRCMMQAVYACSGVLNYADYYHYGLATDIYTVF